MSVTSTVQLHWIDEVTRRGEVLVSPSDFLNGIEKITGSQPMEWNSSLLFSLEPGSVSLALLETTMSLVVRELTRFNRAPHSISVVKSSPLDGESGVSVEVMVYLWPHLDLSELDLQTFERPDFTRVKSDEVSQMVTFVVDETDQGSFAKELGLKSAQHFNEVVEQSIYAERVYAFGKRLERSVIDFILKQHSFSVPRSLLNDEIASLKGMKVFENRDQTVLHDEALFQARAKCILFTVAEQNSIGPSGSFTEERLLSALDLLLAKVGAQVI